MKKLNDKSGNIGVVSIILILVFMLLMAGTTQMIKPFMISTTVNGALQQASSDVAAQNAYTLYNGVRESNNASAEWSGREWKVASLNTAVMGRLKQLLRLSYNGSAHEQVDDKGLVSYSITNVSVSCSTLSVQSYNKLQLITTLELHIPLRLGNGKPIAIVKVPMKIKTKYTPLY